jgi:hypothetical protein
MIKSYAPPEKLREPHAFRRFASLPFAGRTFHAMSVVPVTIFFSLLLAGLFTVLFVREQRRRRFASPERDSLLPLAEETPRLLERAGDGPSLAASARPTGLGRRNHLSADGAVTPDSAHFPRHP